MNGSTASPRRLRSHGSGGTGPCGDTPRPPRTRKTSEASSNASPKRKRKEPKAEPSPKRRPEAVPEEADDDEAGDADAVQRLRDRKIRKLEPDTVKSLSQPSRGVGPAHLVPPSQQVPTTTTASSSKGPKLEASMEARLQKLSGGPSGASSGESLALLLTQALHAKDDDKLDLVLDVAEPRRQKATLDELPLPLVLPFLAALRARIANRIELRNLLRWLHLTLSTHMSFLSSSPAVAAQLGELGVLLRSRQGSLEPLLSLQGRLHLLLDQSLRREARRSGKSDVPSTAVLYTEDSDSADEDAEEGDESAEEDDDEDDEALGQDWWDEGDADSTEEDEPADEDDEEDDDEEEEEDEASDGAPEDDENDSEDSEAGISTRPSRAARQRHEELGEVLMNGDADSD